MQEMRKTNRKWSTEDRQFLTDNFSKKGVRFCADHFQVKENTVRGVADYMGLGPPAKAKVRNRASEKKWSDEDKQFLRENYSKGGNYCARHLGRTQLHVNAAAHRLGLSTPRKSTPYIYGDISRDHWLRIRRAAKSRNLQFDIDPKDIWDMFIRQNERCAISGIDIVLPVAKARWGEDRGTASLDRIDSSAGYLLHNCQWTHKTVNKMKLTMSTEEFVGWCDLIVNNNK